MARHLLDAHRAVQVRQAHTAVFFGQVQSQQLRLTQFAQQRAAVGGVGFGIAVVRHDLAQGEAPDLVDQGFLLFCHADGQGGS